MKVIYIKTLLILLMLIFIGIFIFIFNPLWRVALTKFNNIQNKENNIVVLNKTIDQVKEYKAIEKEVVKVFKALPPDYNDEPELIALFQNMTMLNGVIMESIDFDASDNLDNTESSASESFPYVMANLKINCTYNNFKKFLKAIESNVRAMDVSSISFNSATCDMPGVGQSELDVNITIKVYYQ